MEKTPEMILTAIGTVRNGVKDAPGAGYDWQKVTSEIIFDTSLTEAFEGIEKFSHLIVLFWLHQFDPDRTLPPKIHPRGDTAIPIIGRFATRSPHRPNPIGKTTVRLLSRDKTVLKVTGLDALDGTPVLDIKPYLPRYDSVVDAKTPPWATKN